MSYSPDGRRRVPRVLVACVFLISKLTPRAQQPAQRGPQTPSQGIGTVSTGAARTNASKRTVGGVAPKAPPVFEDVTAKTALAAFRHKAGLRCL